MGSIILEREGFIATIFLNRPERRNALNPEMFQEIQHILKSFEDEDTVRVVIFRGTGDIAFSSGYDVSTIDGERSPGFFEKGGRENALGMGLKSVAAYPYPTIAMVNGLAFGAGCELTINCDLRIAKQNAKFCMPPAKIGTVHTSSGLAKFIEVIGLANTKEMFFTTRAYDALRAKEMGLINYVVPDHDLETFTYAMAKEISENAPLSLKGIKKVISLLKEDEVLNKEKQQLVDSLIHNAFQSEDFKEGIRTRLKKVKPIFKGR